MTRALAALASLAIALHGPAALAAAGGCHAGARVVGPCFTVRGRLFVANGTPTFRIHPTGSRRHLGVFDGGYRADSPDVLPAAVRAVATPASPGELNPVDGTWRLCPLAKERPGRMRPVCIDEARDLRARPPRG